jgi:hypothetical protein
MDYFLIKHDHEYTDAPRTAGLGRALNTAHFYNDLPQLIPMRTVVPIYANDHNDFTDYLYQTIPLLSDKATNVIRRFDDDFALKDIVLADPKNSEDRLYHLPFFPRFPEGVMLAPDSPYSLGSVEQRVEIRLRIPYVLPVFYVFWKGNCLPFMRLDVVESLLRNGCRGFVLWEAQAHEG